VNSYKSPEPGIDAPIIQAQLEALLSSKEFADSWRLKKFLTFTFAAYLGARTESLKEYVIAEEVFDQKAYDSSQHSAVRAAASRLRKKLAKYYETDGLSDPIFVEYPEGAYVPRFTARPQPAHQPAVDSPGGICEEPVRPAGKEGETPAAAITKWPGRLRGIAILVVLLVCLAAAAAWATRFRNQAVVGPVTAGANRSMAALNFKNLSGEQQSQWLSTALPELLVSDLTSNGRLRRISANDVARAVREAYIEADGATLSHGSLRGLGTNLGADLVITGAYTVVSDEIRLDVTVYDPRTGAQMAAAVETGRKEELFDLILKLDRDLAKNLQSPQITESAAVQQRASLPAKPEARQAYYDSLAKLRAGKSKEARQLFEKVVLQAPDFAPGHFRLAEALGILGYETEAAKEAKKAFDLSAGLGREQALFIEARYDETIRDWPSATRVYESLFAFFPDNLEYGLGLASATARLGKEREAYGVLDRLRKQSVEFRGDPLIDATEASVADLFADYDRETRAASLAEAGARKRGALLLAAHAELLEGWALDSQGKLSQAEAKDQDAKTIYVSFADRGGEAQAWKNLGDVFMDEQKPERAKEAYERSIAAYREIGWKSGEVIGLNNLGYVLRDSGDLTGAGDLFHRALAIAKSLGDERLEALVLNGVGIVLKRQGNFDGATDAYKDALEILRRLPNKAKTATMSNNLAALLVDQGKLNLARDYFNEALRLYKETNRPADIAMVLGNLGDVALREGDLLTAENRAREQLGMAKTIPDLKQTAAGLYRLGEVSFQRDDLVHARDYFQQSLTLREQIHEGGEVAESRLALAEVSLEGGLPGEAENQARQAEAEFQKEGQVGQVMVSKALIARSLLAQHRTSEAADAADAAMKLAGGLEDQDSKVDAELQVWKVFESTGRHSDAAHLAKSVLDDSRASGSVLYMLRARVAVGQLETAEGRPEGTHLLRNVKREATAHGLLLIAKEASTPEQQAAAVRAKR
jgi:tetratricopeptide (TPR) repeat protein